MDDSHSYAPQQLGAPGKAGEKVLEEAEELVRAAREDTSQRVSQDASLAHAERVLDGRCSR